MPRASQKPPPYSRSNNTAMYVAIGLLVIVIAVAVFFFIQSQKTAPPGQTESASSTSPADWISDDRIIFGGIPRPMPTAGREVIVDILKNSAYLSGYSETRRDPLWVAYRVFPNPSPYDLPRPGRFTTDPRTTALVKTTDFNRSGYDRGHMAPNSVIARDYGEQAQLETFYLSNICPQSPALNEKVWERLESDEKKYAESFGETWVLDGPIFADLNGGRTDHLASGIAVPTAFYKILIEANRGKPRVFSVIMPQNVTGTELPQQFLSTVSEIEKETHLQFLWKLDAATRAQLDDTKWPMW